MMEDDRRMLHAQKDADGQCLLYIAVLRLYATQHHMFRHELDTR